MVKHIHFGVALMAFLSLHGCREQIQHNLDERQANDIQTVLIGQGVAAQKVLEPGKKPTWAIEVDEHESSRAVQILAELGLPRPPDEGVSDLFGSGSLIRTPVEEQILSVQILEHGLEKTLQTLDGVLRARVHLAISPPPRPGQVGTPPKASAMLKVHPGKGEHLQRLEENIQQLISGGVDGLTPEAVTLLIDEVSLSSHPAKEASVSPIRWILVAVGLLVTASAGVALIFFSLRRKVRHSREVPPPAPIVSPKPPALPSAPRKAA